MNPALILAIIAGGASGVFIFDLFNAGLVATPSPGSIVALFAMTPKGSFVGVSLGVLVSTAVSFLVASIFVKSSSKELNDEELEKATVKMKELKNKKEESIEIEGEIRKIVFACDAGMGSSAMGASLLRDKVKKAGLDIPIVNCAIEDIPKDGDIIITHKNLTERAKEKAPDKRHISIDDFLATSVYEKLIGELIERGKLNNNEERKQKDKTASDNILLQENIILGLDSSNREDAIDLVGKLLVESNYVKPGYIK